MINENQKREIWAVVLIALSLLVFISLISYQSGDLKFSTSAPNAHIKNYAGIIGAYLSFGLMFLLGLASYAVCILTFIWGLSRLLGNEPQRLFIKAGGTVVLLVALSSFLSMIIPADNAVKFRAGGITGLLFSDFLIKYLGYPGGLIVVLALFILSALLATEFLLLPFARGFVAMLKKAAVLAAGLIRRRPASLTPKRAPSAPDAVAKAIAKEEKERVDFARKAAKEETSPAGDRRVIQIEKEIEAVAEKIKAKKERAVPAKEEPAAVQMKLVGPGYKMPALDLLNSPPPLEERTIVETVEENTKILEGTLADFGIEAHVVNVDQGPTITRYELQPPPGIKVNRIVALSDDIALAMKAQSVRIVAPIPGKGTVGVEVPNSQTAFVYLKEILESGQYKKAAEKSKLIMALGKDIAGEPLVTDLDDMPHLLIAGATGSGKTVCVNTIVASLLYNATPDEIKFLMIDPKMVELAVYNDIPHLLCPVVTDAKRVASALGWVVNEMERRYKLFAKIGARNITVYHQRYEKEKDAKAEERLEPLPYIIVIIDELADLMLVAPDTIENAITRLAQLSRAVGIHIILATQRPSVDVITGVIKANFPARIAFKVASKVDSRTILDMNGADKLLGKGDMLFMRPGAPKPVRGQGSLTQDSELETIVNFIKSQSPAIYNEAILAEQKKAVSGRGSFERDEVYEEAVRVVLQTRQASVSMLQRRLGLGYTRAARLIDMMEADGIVGPYCGSKPREILVEPEGEPRP